MVGLDLAPGEGDERQNGGGNNMGSPLEGCRYRRMK
jgi:hypothetical protein